MGSTNPVRPPRLAPGSRVALVSPAGPCLERDDLTRGQELCRALGFEPVLMPHAGDRHGYLAGTDHDRLADLNRALADPAIDAVWCLRGGYGITRILDRVDLAPLNQRPKAVIGFSDVTALISAVRARAGIVAYHGPMARAPLTGFSRGAFERVLMTAGPAGLLPSRPAPAGVLVPREARVITIQGGTAEGPLVGGNLTLLHCLVGTPDLPDFDGAILFLEDVGEDLYRVDRVLAHFRALGLLARLAGVLVGQFTEMRRSTGDGGFGFDEVMAEYFGPLGIPCVLGAPVGHVDDQWTLPLGVRARLNATTGDLELTEAAVT